jgi:hypothetical protein
MINKPTVGLIIARRSSGNSYAGWPLQHLQDYPHGNYSDTRVFGTNLSRLWAESPDLALAMLRKTVSADVQAAAVLGVLPHLRSAATTYAVTVNGVLSVVAPGHLSK